MNTGTIFDSLITAAQRLGTQLAAFAPSLLAAVGLLLAGWIVGRLLARGIGRLMDRLAPRIEARASWLTARRLGIAQRLAAGAGGFVFWIVFAVFALAAVETLGLPIVADWLGVIGAVLPRLFLGGLIVVAGLLGGAIARDAVLAGARAGGVDRAAFLGRAAQGVVVVTAIVTGLDQVGLDSRFLTAMVVVTLGAALGGTALAFAFGARTEVSNLVAMHYVRQAYRVGQPIRLGAVRGRIRDFTATTVVVGGAEGESRVPGRMFSDQVTEVPASEG